MVSFLSYAIRDYFPQKYKLLSLHNFFVWIENHITIHKAALLK